MKADPNKKSWLVINITGDVNSILASQGIFFYGKIFNPSLVAEQSK
jgi:hypothetical protein